MQHIQTVTVGSGGAASITFSAIPADFTDLIVVSSARNTSTDNFFLMGFNGLTTNFSHRFLQGTGSSVSSGSASSQPFISQVPSGDTANTFSNSTIYIPNYQSSQNKSISIDTINENNATAARATIEAALRSNTAAITSIEFSVVLGSFAQHTSFSLYGITAGSDGITAVS